MSETLQVAILWASSGHVEGSAYGPVISAHQTLGDEKLTWEATTARLLLEYNSRRRTGSRAAHRRGEARALMSMARVKCFNCKG